jgi:hypothetical protein
MVDCGLPTQAQEMADQLYQTITIPGISLTWELAEMLASEWSAGS